MSRGPDAATLLERALMADAARAGIEMMLTQTAATRWASATFIGARHRLTLAGPASDGLTTWLGGLGEADLPLRGHLVADLAVEGWSRDDGGFSATIEVLTVEDR